MTMPNMPDPDKHLVGIRMPRTLHKRLQKLAQERKITVKNLIIEILIRETINTVLTPEDYEQIAEETRKAVKRNKNR